MNADELMRRVVEHGADERGINDRFMGNVELYQGCFLDFLEEPHLDTLRQAMARGDFEEAFSSAHALKGIAGNLGLDETYEAICVLVESLRAKDFRNVDAEYAAVERQFEGLARLLAEDAQVEGQDVAAGPPVGLPAEGPAEGPVGPPVGPPAEGHAPEGAPPEGHVPPDCAGTGEPEPDALAAGPPTERPAAASKGRPAKRTRRKDLFAPLTVLTLLVVLTSVSLVFYNVYLAYRENVALESADHLVEISNQLKLYIEERIGTDWKTAHSVSDSIEDGNYVDDDAAILSLMAQKQNVWQVSDIMFYTENGYSIRADGRVGQNDIASEAIDGARKQGECLSIIDSEFVYTVPVETELRYNGSKIAAVAVVQSMESFLDDMGFSAFGGEAWMYLTEEDGMVVSKLTNELAPSAFNFMAIAEGKEITGLPDGSATGDDLLAVATSTAFMMRGDEGNSYVVSTPISARNASLRLFFLAPEDAVNETASGFSRQLAFLSFVTCLAFAALAIFVFLGMYRMRKKRFDEQLLARDHMFDLLMKNTHSAFGLFAANEKEPTYVSSNAIHVVGDRYFALDKTAAGFAMRNSTNTDTEAIRQINEEMRGWDGKSEFKSDYILNDRAVPPNYFEIQLYPEGGADEIFVGIAQDVTQTYEREQAIKSALEMAERANDAKSRFLSNMSHDIRTPMNAIVNMTDFAQESIDDPKRLQEYLHTIRESSDHLLRIINDVLDMSRIESGQTVIGSEPFDITEELGLQADIIRLLCDAKGQTFITDFEGIRTTAVIGDPLKFSQIITNLLSNAVKFTPDNGAIRFVAAEIPSLRDDIASMRFTIEDTGIGISPEYMQHIFEPFSRADNNRVSRVEGTGLGLSICHSYITAMGGTIQCESEEGEGTVFTVELFFQKADSVPAKVNIHGVVGEMPFLGHRCLVGEDNSTNQAIARTMLERLGFMVDVAADGREVVQMFLKSRPGCYAVIYLDIQMPVMDGYQAAVAIRESAHDQAKTIPIVAMTANVFAEDIEKARIAGMDGHLGKPIMSLKLLEETYRVIDGRREGWA